MTWESSYDSWKTTPPAEPEPEGPEADEWPRDDWDSSDWDEVAFDLDPEIELGEEVR